MNKFFYYIIVAGFIIVLILGGIIFYQKNNHDLRVIFLDVGQGDAILIEQGSNQMLIDGGRNGKTLLEKLGKYIPFWDRQIEIMVATHPDQDHIGGLIDTLENYKVNAIIKTEAESESRTFKALDELIREENADNIEAEKGVKIKFPAGAEGEIIYPFSSEAAALGESNAGSVVLKLTFGENNFLFTGDLPSEKELILIRDSLALNSRVIKVAHHGSKYSTSEEFLEAVKPEDAIISVGKNNQYGHPALEVIERILKHGIKIFRTDEMGDIIYECKNQNSKCKIEFN